MESRVSKVMRVLRELHQQAYSKLHPAEQVLPAAQNLLLLQLPEAFVLKTRIHLLAILTLTRVLRDLGSPALTVEEVGDRFQAIKGFRCNWHLNRPRSTSPHKGEAGDHRVLRDYWKRLESLTQHHHYQQRQKQEEETAAAAEKGSRESLRHEPEVVRRQISELCRQLDLGPQTTDYALTVGSFACNHPAICNFKSENLVSGVVAFAHKQAELAQAQERKVYLKQICQTSTSSVYQVIAALNGIMASSCPQAPAQSQSQSQSQLKE